MMDTLTKNIALDIGEKVETLISEALENEAILGANLENIYWIVSPNGVETLCFNGKPLFELHPIEVKHRGEGTSCVYTVSRKYRSLA